jgi:hypothetical protein
MAQLCKRKGQKCWNSQTKRKHWSIVSHAAKSRPLSVCFFFTSCAPYRPKKIWQKLWFMSWNFLGRSLTSTLPAALTYCLTCDLARFIWHICQHLIWHTSCDIHMYIAYILKCDGANFTWHLVWFVLWQKQFQNMLTSTLKYSLTFDVVNFMCIFWHVFWQHMSTLVLTFARQKFMWRAVWR